VNQIAETLVGAVTTFNLDGVDIDYEYDAS
jgi:GH18 family chitinase